VRGFSFKANKRPFAGMPARAGGGPKGSNAKGINPKGSNPRGSSYPKAKVRPH
jgi:hypothetical protein